MPILHPPRVELPCKLQEKLHCVTGPLKIQLVILTSYHFALLLQNILEVLRAYTCV